MKWFVYLIPEETSGKKSFYCGETSDPERRWEEHKKKRYSNKCKRCNGKGIMDNTNSRSFRDRNEPCSKCEGKGKIPGKRKNAGEMRTIPKNLIVDENGSVALDLDFSFPSLSEAIIREKKVKRMKQAEKEAYYKAGKKVTELK